MGIEIITEDLLTKGIILSRGQKAAITRFINKNCSYYYFLNFIRITEGNVSDAIKLYKFDETFRNLILKFILRLEVQMKKDFINCVEDSTNTSCFWNNSTYYKSSFTRRIQNHESKFDKLIRDSKNRMREMNFSGIGPSDNRMFYSTSFGAFKTIYSNINGLHHNNFRLYYMKHGNTEIDKMNSYLNAIKKVRNRCGHSNHLISPKFKYVIESTNLVLIDLDGYIFNSNFNKVLYFIYSRLLNNKDMRQEFIKVMNKNKNIILTYSGRHILNEETYNMITNIWL